jgi:hypothetical protein
MSLCWGTDRRALGLGAVLAALGCWHAGMACVEVRVCSHLCSCIDRTYLARLLRRLQAHKLWQVVANRPIGPRVWGASKDGCLA